MEYSIYVKPHLKKFLPRYFNTPEPIKIDSTNVHGKVFTAVSVVQQDTLKLDFTEDGYSKKISFFLSNDLKRIKPKKRDMVKINVYFNKLFMEIMFQWALSALHQGNTASDGLRAFMTYYRIDEDDYPWLSAHRAWMRYVKREHEKKCTMAS